MNKLFCDDNLNVLKTLPSYSIDLIYCDVLYGTGRNFGEYQDLKTNRSVIERHYQPRFEEMHRVLKDTGQIYIQMDTRISHWVRCMLDDIFGYRNFRNEIIWHYNSAPRKKNCFGSRHDNIFRYSKTDSFILNEDECRIPYSTTAPRGFAKEKYYNSKGKVVGDVWTDIKMLAQNDKTERTGYPTQKPEKLLERIIATSSGLNQVVADFYCGSGTTCVVAKRLGRQYIGVDTSQEAIDIATERLK